MKIQTAKLALSSILTLIILTVSTAPASAEEAAVDKSRLDSTQQETVDDFMSGEDSQSVTLSPKNIERRRFLRSWSFDVKATRGSVLMGAETRIQGATNLSTITWEYASQKARYVFPNTAEAMGINKYHDTSTLKLYDSQFKLGAGTVTPWGSVNVYTFWDSQWGRVTPTTASVWN